MQGQGLLPDRAFAEQVLDQALNQMAASLSAAAPSLGRHVHNPRVADVARSTVRSLDGVLVRLARAPLARIGLSDETINSIV